MYSIQITEVFEDWFTGLKDRMVKVRIQARIDRVAAAALNLAKQL